MEEKEVLEAEVANEEEEAQVEEQPIDFNKKALTAFILTVVALTICGFSVVGSLAAIIVGAIGLKTLKVTKGAELDNPYRVFAKIAKPVGIVAVILGAVLLAAQIIFAVLAVLFGVGAVALYALSIVLPAFAEGLEGATALAVL